MVFADLFFIYFFLPLCLIFYFTAKTLDRKNLVLIIFSLVFYAWGKPLYVLLLLFSAGFNWALGLALEKFRGTPMSKIVLGAGIAVDLALLLVFKYSGALFRAQAKAAQAAMPIGIGVFTLQAVSYLVDCFREKVAVQHSFKKFLLYLSLFPQLLAGPIVRYSAVEQAIDDRRTSVSDACDGALRVIVGLAKKVILANNLYAIVTAFFGNDISGLSVLGTWYTAVIFTLYIYFEFSGYADIAIGLGRIFGFRFDENFNYPFAGRTVTDFCGRWYLSLGAFFRDYVLSLPFFGKNYRYLGLFLVWLCTGMWFGSGWNFILWGLYLGFFLFFEQTFGKNIVEKWPVWVKHIYSKLVIVLGFGIFYFRAPGQLVKFFGRVSGLSMLTSRAPFADSLTWASFTDNFFLIAAAVICSLPLLPRIKTFFLKNRNHTVYAIGRYGALACCAAMLVILSILLAGAAGNSLAYFRF